MDAALHLLEEESLVGALLLLRVSGDAFLWRFSPASMQPLAIPSAAGKFLFFPNMMIACIYTKYSAIRELCPFS